jgi:Helicase HerA, central domain
MIENQVLIYSFIGFVLVSASILIFIIVKKIRYKYFLNTLKLRVLEVKLIKKSETENNKEAWAQEINLSGQLISILANLKVPFAFEVSVNYLGEEIGFYVAVPGDSIQFTMRQIQSLWPDAQVEEIEDYNIFNNQGSSVGAFLKQKQNASLPIRTFEEAQVDTFLPLLSNLSKVEVVGEGISLQVLIKPAPRTFKKAFSGVLRSLKKGEKFEDAIKTVSPLIGFGDVMSALNPETPEEKAKKAEDKMVIDEETIKAVEKKLSKPLFSVDVRIVVSTPSKARSEEVLNSFMGSFDQFSAPLRNEFSFIKPRNQNNFLFKYIFREFDDNQSMILGTDELISIFHFPTSLTEVPRIKWLKSREVAPPSNLSKDGVLIGKSVFRKEEKKVFISEEDRRRHVYVVGQTGTGKSTLLKNMASSDIADGKGVAIIDPHGDFIDDILALIPKNRHDDVIVFDPSDITRPIGLNMLEYDLSRPEEKTFIVNEIQGIFNKLFSADTMGPMFEQYMRNALLLLMEDAANEPPTFLDVPRIFTDSDFRKKKLENCQNPIIKDFWEREALMVGGEASLQNITPYITSKFNNFIANDYIRPIISQPKSTFNFREMMDQGKILLVNMSKGKIGDINASLLGMIIVGKILMAAMSRADVEMEKRKDFNLYIDEFQNFTTDSIATILSEARKYRLNLIIAHQFIAQILEKIRDSVFGNIGSIISFRVGPDDAEFLEKQFSPIFNKNDLMNIDNFNAHIKLLIDNQTSKPFNIKIFPPEKGDLENKNILKNLSRTKYGLDRSEV